MNKSRLLSEFARTPWALHPAVLGQTTTVLANWAGGVIVADDVRAAIAEDRGHRAARRQTAQTASAGGIAVLPLYGIITQRGNMADEISGPGSTSTQKFSTSLQQAIDDPAVGQILIDIDSPGGSVYGVAELSRQIYQARNKKPVIGISNALCASAAYWIGSQCSELYCTPSGEVGSIGVYLAHTDMSKALDTQGYKVQLISAGKYKTEGNPYEPLGPDARAALQTSVDGYYNAFSKDVARGRNVPISKVRDGMGLLIPATN